MSHEYHIKHLKSHPKELGLENVIWSANEVLFFDGKRYAGEIDILYYTADYYKRPFHIIEFKTYYAERDKAIEQLMRYKELINKEFGSAYLYFVTINDNNKYILEYIGGRRKTRYKRVARLKNKKIYI